jgi:hypothetical protein
MYQSQYVLKVMSARSKGATRAFDVDSQPKAQKHLIRAQAHHGLASSSLSLACWMAPRDMRGPCTVISGEGKAGEDHAAN